MHFPCYILLGFYACFHHASSTPQPPEFSYVILNQTFFTIKAWPNSPPPPSLILLGPPQPYHRYYPVDPCLRADRLNDASKQCQHRRQLLFNAPHWRLQLGLKSLGHWRTAFGLVPLNITADPWLPHDSYYLYDVGEQPLPRYKLFYSRQLSIPDGSVTVHISDQPPTADSFRYLSPYIHGPILHNSTFAATLRGPSKQSSSSSAKSSNFSASTPPPKHTLAPTAAPTNQPSSSTTKVPSRPSQVQNSEKKGPQNRLVPQPHGNQFPSPTQRTSPRPNSIPTSTSSSPHRVPSISLPPGHRPPSATHDHPRPIQPQNPRSESLPATPRSPLPGSSGHVPTTLPPRPLASTLQTPVQGSLPNLPHDRPSMGSSDNNSGQRTGHDSPPGRALLPDAESSATPSASILQPILVRSQRSSPDLTPPTPATNLHPRAIAAFDCSEPQEITSIKATHVLDCPLPEINITHIDHSIPVNYTTTSTFGFNIANASSRITP